MNPQDPLAQLHPLREPLPIGWWPPAPGWWLLAVLLLVLLLALAWYLLRRYRARAYRRVALTQLARLQADYRQHGDALQFVAQTNALLKSVALVSYPRREVAASTGADWLAFLNAGLGQDARFPAGFASGAYLRQDPDIDIDQLQRSAASWIKRHRVAR
ncbi:MAG: DUF4381 domain-containing protein [Halioglobus sp.]|nr:DUF4381 domain-containing protein [Halioglobus sp.]MBP6723492.1 DUF4381 domain-containing protein [Halioglobus sp.]